MAYVKFNSNNRSEFHSMTSFDGGEEISNELHGKDLVKEGDTIRALTDEEIASDLTTFRSNATADMNRFKRDNLLTDSDWVVTKATEEGVSISAAWVTYRQALRDLPDHENWPLLEDADWPTAP